MEKWKPLRSGRWPFPVKQKNSLEFRKKGAKWSEAGYQTSEIGRRQGKHVGMMKVGATKEGRQLREGNMDC